MAGRCESGRGSGAIGSMASTPRFGSFYSGRKEGELDCSSLFNLTKPHVESYDYFVDRGLEEAVRRLQPVELKHPVSGASLRYILSVNFTTFGLELWLSSPHAFGAIDQRCAVETGVTDCIFLLCNVVFYNILTARVFGEMTMTFAIVQLNVVSRISSMPGCGYR